MFWSFIFFITRYFLSSPSPSLSSSPFLSLLPLPVLIPRAAVLWLTLVFISCFSYSLLFHFHPACPPYQLHFHYLPSSLPFPFPLCLLPNPRFSPPSLSSLEVTLIPPPFSALPSYSKLKPRTPFDFYTILFFISISAQPSLTPSSSSFPHP